MSDGVFTPFDGLGPLPTRGDDDDVDDDDDDGFDMIAEKVTKRRMA